MNEDLMLIYEILVDFDNRNPSTLFFPGDLRENDAMQDDVLGLIAKIWDINDHIQALNTSVTTLGAIASEAEKIMNLGCNFDSKVYEVTDNIIIEKFNGQPDLLKQLLEGVEGAIASLNKFQFTDTEISQALKMQVEQVLGEADKVIKQNPNDFDYTTRRIESSNAEDIIKFDGGLDRLLEYAKSLLTRKENWYSHLIAVKVKRILDAGCKYENNKLTFTDDKLICRLVEGDFTAIANMPTDLLNKLVDWKVKEYGQEETDEEFINGTGGDSGGDTGEEPGGDTNKLDCRDFPVNAMPVSGRPLRPAILSYARLGKPVSKILRQNNTRTSSIGGGNKGEVFVLHNNPYDVEEIFVLPMCFDKSHIPISWGDRVVHWGNGRKEHREEMISFYTRTGAIAHGKQSPMYINLRLPSKGKFAFFKHGWNNYGITSTPWEWSNPSKQHWRYYNPFPNSSSSAATTTQGEAIAKFQNVEFPGAVFVIPRLFANYLATGVRPGQMPYNVLKSGFLIYASTCRTVTINGDTRTEVPIRAYDLGSFRKRNAYQYLAMFLGSTEPIMESLNFDPQLKPRVRLYSDIGGKEFLCCSHDEDREIFKVDFSKPNHPYNTIVASDVSKFTEYGKFGFTLVQVHLPPEKQNVYPLVEHVYTNGTGASFRLWDARTGQELRDRFPISVLSVQHH